MAATVTVVASGAWTDFSAFSKKLIALSQAIPVGHRAVFVLGSTVDGGVAPDTAGYGGIDDTLYDTHGNTWTRDGYSLVDGTDAGTTVEVWSTFVGPTTALPTSGFGLNVKPDSRGLSAHWALYDLDGTAENNGVSPVDASAAALMVNTTAWETGSVTLAQADEIVFAVYSGTSAALPSTPWLTDTAGFTSDVQFADAADGSNQIFAALHKEYTGGGSAQSTGTRAASGGGAGVLVAYKVGTPAAVTYPKIRRLAHASVNAASVTSQGVTFDTTGADLLIVAAPTWHSAGQTSTIADNKGNTWHQLPVSVPSTSGLAKMYVWYAWNAVTGSGHTITVTSSKSASEITIDAYAFSGSQTTADPLDQRNTHTSSATAATPGSVTTATDDELYFTAFTEDAGTTSINPQGWVQEYDVATNQDCHTLWQTHAAQTVNPSLSFVGSSTSYAAVIGTFKAAATTSTVVTGLAATTSTGLASTAAKTRATGQAIETELGLIAGRIKERLTGLSLEQDTAQPSTRQKTRATGLATSAATAFASTAAKIRTTGLPVELDEALANAGRLVIQTGIALTAAVGLAAAVVKQRLTGQAVETDTAVTSRAAKLRVTGIAVVATQALSSTSRKIRTTAVAAETDIALAARVILGQFAGLAVTVRTLARGSGTGLTNVAVGGTGATGTARTSTGRTRSNLEGT